MSAHALVPFFGTDVEARNVHSFVLILLLLSRL